MTSYSLGPALVIVSTLGLPGALSPQRRRRSVKASEVRQRRQGGSQKGRWKGSFLQQPATERVQWGGQKEEEQRHADQVSTGPRCSPGSGHHSTWACEKGHRSGLRTQEGTVPTGSPEQRGPNKELRALLSSSNGVIDLTQSAFYTYYIYSSQQLHYKEPSQTHFLEESIEAQRA